MRTWIKADEQLPEYGRKVIAYYKNGAGKSRKIMACWVPPKTEEADGNSDELVCEWDEGCEEYFIKAGWYEQIDNWPDYASVAVIEGKVTHWMGLPPSLEVG